MTRRLSGDSNEMSYPIFMFVFFLFFFWGGGGGVVVVVVFCFLGFFFEK